MARIDGGASMRSRIGVFARRAVPALAPPALCCRFLPSAEAAAIRKSRVRLHAPLTIVYDRSVPTAASDYSLLLTGRGRCVPISSSSSAIPPMTSRLRAACRTPASASAEASRTFPAYSSPTSSPRGTRRIQAGRCLRWRNARVRARSFVGMRAGRFAVGQVWPSGRGEGGLVASYPPELAQGKPVFNDR